MLKSVRIRATETDAQRRIFVSGSSRILIFQVLESERRAVKMRNVESSNMPPLSPFQIAYAEVAKETPDNKHETGTLALSPIGLRMALSNNPT